MNETQKVNSRITVRNIAERSGASISAVSSVLNGLHKERRIAASTVEKIRSNIAELGYLPNISARKLRGGQEATRNLILALITSYQAPLPVIGHFVVALRKAISENYAHLSQYTFSVVIEMFHAGKLHELPGIRAGTHFNAAIITDTTPEDDAFLKEVKLPYPVVLVNRKIENYTSIVEDPESGALAAKTLIQQGRKKLALIAGQPLTQITQKRVDAFLNEVAQQGLSPAIKIISPDLQEETAQKEIAQVLKQHPEVDGIYTVSDSLALGAYQAAKSLGRKIPFDLFVLSVGDYQLANFFDPALSTVGVSHQQLASEAALLLLSRLGGPERNSVNMVVPLSTQIRI